jgi:hypothetical protein
VDVASLGISKLTLFVFLSMDWHDDYF